VKGHVRSVRNPDLTSSTALWLTADWVDNSENVRRRRGNHRGHLQRKNGVIRSQRGTAFCPQTETKPHKTGCEKPERGEESKRWLM